ncbi:sulfotransferase [Oscillatoria sp. FACHB-1407]|uniref:sulfotransferase n=1 Tax=Oscillatoria sp. FACHB-1407 TaxID=2692847 RepID=UPI001684E283|nr:sulfotransferase [Oscillatoria sp. FACHB-1407]MBD2462875.1 sulfotransferase [Oscillatoria sp. FACHB-1407]
MARQNQKVCFIAGTGHSGSTLLGLILGSHSQVFYAGEAAKTRFLQNETKKLAKRVCKICGEHCPVWEDFQISQTPDLYEQISIKVNQPVVVDSTKNVDWIRQQLISLKSTSTEPFLIFLQRDGRAVINSRIRKYPTQSPHALIADWQTQIQKTNQLFEEFSYAKMKVRYEQLATDPTEVMQQICNLLDLEYQPEMLNYANHEHHVLGGNDGTQFLVAQAQRDRIQTPFVQLSERNRYYYENHSSHITLDLRWQHELDPAIAQLFEDMAGQDNQELQWDT